MSILSGYVADKGALGPGAARPLDRRARYHKGRFGELVAALVLIAKGYRILHWRARTPMGEIDLIARRGRRLAFVEVKVRASLEDAQAAISTRQQKRLIGAAETWVARRPAYQGYEIGIDALFICPWQRPRHQTNVFYHC